MVELNYVPKDDLLDRLQTKIWRAERDGRGWGRIGITEVTKGQHQIKNWYAIGDFSPFGTFYPWYDIYLGNDKKLEALKSLLKEVCDENSIYCIYE